MWIKIEINMESIKQKILKSAIKTVSETTNAIYMDVRKFSPILTWKYVSGHKNLWVRVTKHRVIGTIENVGEYPEKVETGWRKKAVNWNLQNIWQIYNSVWANVYAKAVAKNKDIFLRKLKWQ